MRCDGARQGSADSRPAAIEVTATKERVGTCFGDVMACRACDRIRRGHPHDGNRYRKPRIKQEVIKPWTIADPAGSDLWHAPSVAEHGEALPITGGEARDTGCQRLEHQLGGVVDVIEADEMPEFVHQRRPGHGVALLGL